MTLAITLTRNDEPLTLDVEYIVGERTEGLHYPEVYGVIAWDGAKAVVLTPEEEALAIAEILSSGEVR